MVSVSLQEFHTNMQQWLQRVQAGEAVQLEENGAPVAVVQPPAVETIDQIIEDLHEIGKRTHCNLSDAEIKELIEEGRA